MMSADLLILGGGESGLGAALLGHALGWKVLLSDGGTLKPKYREELKARGIQFEEGGHHFHQDFNGTVVKSPGIPGTAAAVEQLRKQGAEIISEIEWASRHCQGTMVAITGSNGKTTTTLLTHHLLKAAGMDVAMAGNVGTSVARLLAEGDHAFWVLEVSSFQLDDVVHFKPKVAAILNITPDHLDRYGYQLDAYADAKARIAMNQDENDWLIIPKNDPLVAAALERHPARSHKLYFGERPLLAGEEGAGIHTNNIIHIQLKNQEPMEIFELALEGKHNKYNSMASALAARALEVRKQTIREALMNFENAPHRLESVLTISGVEYINDSKATNVNSCWYALESMNRPVVWIAGGVDKGNQYDELSELVKQKVKALVCLGKDNMKLINSFKDSVDIIAETDSMAAAVQTAHSIARKGDVVLLSPACASFDLFNGYEDRGDQFKSLVRQL
jgi:UDP-N-acetylmuramoylalanine--D-glutamate ligase